MPDFAFADHGSVTILTPLSAAARDWVGEYLPADALAFGRGVVIEPRYVDPIMEALAEHGLTIA